MAERPTHHGVAFAEGRDARDRRAYAQLVRSAESNQNGAVGAGQSVPNALHPHLHRRRRNAAERYRELSIAVKRTTLSARDRLRERGKVPREDRGRAADLERMLKADRQRGHLLQHTATLTCVRTKNSQPATT